MAFFDGMNLFNAVKRSYGYTYPTYDPAQLATAICAANGWQLIQTRFYVGVPDELVDPARHHFWRAKIRVMKGSGVVVESRLLRYALNSSKALVCSNGFPIGREKGIDLRLGLDMFEIANDRVFDVALLFSQDQDFSEAVAAIKRLNANLLVACAFPQESASSPIHSAKPAPFDKALYDACQDPKDYREVVGLSELSFLQISAKVAGLSAYWGRPSTVVPCAGTEISGVQRGLFLVANGDAIICIDDGRKIHVITVGRPIALKLRRNLGKIVALGTFYFNGTPEWCIPRKT